MRCFGCILLSDKVKNGGVLWIFVSCGLVTWCVVAGTALWLR